MEDGVLGRRWYDAKGNPAQLQWLVPRSKLYAVMEAAHSSPAAGHFGDKRTKEALQRRFWWSGMGVAVRIFCQACHVCGAHKGQQSVAHHPQRRETRTEPVQTVALDVIGPLEPPSTRGNQCILVMTDYCTKWVVAAPMPNQTATTCAETFCMRWVCELGMPMQLHSDKGPAFEAKVFKKTCRYLGIHKTHTTAYHPQSDGQTERMNRTLEDVLAKLVQDVPEEWDKWLPIVCFAYNTSVHRVTKETPMRMMMGREARTPLTMLVPPPPDESREQSPWLQELMEQFRDLHADVAVLTQQAHRAEAPWRDRRQRGFRFEPGAQVWLWAARTRPGRSPKMEAQRWTGPWTVDARFSDVVYKISREGQSPQVINVDRIKPYLQLDPIRFPSDETDSGNSSESSESDDENERPYKREQPYVVDEADDERRWISGNEEELHEGEGDREQSPDDDEVIHRTPVTSRAQRARHAPRWLQGYDRST
jgi:hypothetical protein